jgi:hypothetical protein
MLVFEKSSCKFLVQILLIPFALLVLKLLGITLIILLEAQD